ncbi:hypothetical protein BJ875DRAFT_503914 [Amylocarpus encephaloides]|uniref:Ribonuclease H1 N-terminal domain-containing protein n=1 Tax=Amylocarpus encephaloides TaxID=45428 RepID=A0A9P7YLX6_9HELO|nr:hypothetical protein BJ875DRAFT_503914 [Amylocarpus encephaloides]
MVSQRRPNMEYYAVVSGRIDEPTIFSSWGDAHPRVTGCSSVHKAFVALEDAREYTKSKGVKEPKEVIKDGAGETTPPRGSQAFYAVAHGRKPGIYPYWHKSTEPEVKEISGACHKRFRTRSQAEAFIEDWKESFADVWRRRIREGLDQRLQPYDMKLGVEGILHGPDEQTQDEVALDEVKLDKLSLKQEE